MTKTRNDRYELAPVYGGQFYHIKKHSPQLPHPVYLKGMHNGAPAWNYDYTYAKQYSPETAGKMIEKLMKGEC